MHTIERDQKGDVAVPSPGLKGEFQTLPAHRGHRRAVSESLWDSKCNVQKLLPRRFPVLRGCFLFISCRFPVEENTIS